MSILSLETPTLHYYVGQERYWEDISEPNTIYKIYDQYKKQTFPKLLESPNVLPEDKQKITELLKKPWNPYIRRHSALTEECTILKEPVLKTSCRVVSEVSDASKILNIGSGMNQVNHFRGIRHSFRWSTDRPTTS